FQTWLAILVSLEIVASVARVPVYNGFSRSVSLDSSRSGRIGYWRLRAGISFSQLTASVEAQCRDPTEFRGRLTSRVGRLNCRLRYQSRPRNC
ncbi:hypothetical protein PFISCL1PPCAC_11988, partial [Pristionchus fissidentatus]